MNTTAEFLSGIEKRINEIHNSIFKNRTKLGATGFIWDDVIFSIKYTHNKFIIETVFPYNNSGDTDVAEYEIFFDELDFTNEEIIERICEREKGYVEARKKAMEEEQERINRVAEENEKQLFLRLQKKYANG